jgi:hypothetical protein
VTGDNLASMLADIRTFPKVHTSFAFGDQHHITVDSQLTKEELHGYLAEKGYTNVAIREITPTVEDCFLALTKEEN